MSEQEPFIQNPNGVITGRKLNIEWLPKDAYGDLGKWVNWQDSQAYIHTMRGVYAGGHSNWRLPTREEALSLYDENYENKDWEGEMIHLHPMFAGKCGRQIWTSEENEEGQVLVVNLQDGSTDFMDKETREHQSARLVRDPNPPSPAPLD
jgi:hypothetical protein